MSIIAFVFLIYDQCNGNPPFDTLWNLFSNNTALFFYLSHHTLCKHLCFQFCSDLLVTWDTSGSLFRRSDGKPDARLGPREVHSNGTDPTYLTSRQFEFENKTRLLGGQIDLKNVRSVYPIQVRFRQLISEKML